MVQKLPTSGFKWLDDIAQIQANPEKFLLELDDNGDQGYFLEVDLEIPQDKHDCFKEFPPAPVRRAVTNEELSPYQQDQLEGKRIDTVRKLICDLHPKANYKAHFRALKQYVQLGCRVTKVHKVMQFNQQAYMKKFIDFNNSMRAKAMTEFQRNFWKLLNNSNFGKQMENKRNRQNVNIITDPNAAARLNAKPTVQNIIPVDDETCIYVMKRKNVLLDRQ
jgi:hypothetical protein